MHLKSLVKRPPLKKGLKLVACMFQQVYYLYRKTMYRTLMPKKGICCFTCRHVADSMHLRESKISAMHGLSWLGKVA